ncbi:tumor necrosis factor receptor superfamily member 6-like [Argopecten irradians]|uniref:tumor necrosis factor receptor superfamily member 6-like n=1 Tax=Argopecten irradians TaxID=31199 RepID=UPI00372065BD
MSSKKREMKKQKTRHRYCDFKHHKYYNPQVPRCKRCDKCPVGMGLVPFAVEPIEIDVKHGAMLCQRCVSCEAGKTFSQDISFKQCRPCKDCEALGMEERMPCTPSSNTRCRYPVPTLSAVCNTTEQNRTPGVVNHVTAKEVPMDNIYLGFAVIVILLMVFSPIALSYCFRPKNRLKKKRKKSQDAPQQRVPSEVHVEMPLLDILIPEPLTEKALVTPAARLVTGEDYRALGIQLGITDTELAIITADHRGNSREISFRVLVQWKKKLGNKATYDKLYNGLRKIKRLDVIDAMEKERHSDKADSSGDTEDIAENPV